MRFKHLEGAIDWTLEKIKPFAPLIAFIACTAAAYSAWRAHEAVALSSSVRSPAMSIAFAPSPIRYVSADALFVAFEQSPIQAGGEPSPSKFWNHAAGGFESGPLVPAKHIRPLSRMAPSGSINSAFQGFGVPFDVANASAVHALLYKANASGGYVEWGRVEGPSLACLSGSN